MTPTIERLEQRRLLSGYLLTQLAKFPNSNGGDGDSNVVIDSDGNLFAVTGKGGQDQGSIIEIAHGSSSIAVLAEFNGVNGYSPVGLSIDSSGNLYGADAGDGATQGSADGTIFMLPKASSIITTLAAFNGANGSSPTCCLMDSSGDIFGAAGAGGDANGDGVIFELPHGGSTIVTVAQFNGTNGRDPDYLIMDSAGDFYGGTISGGTSDNGTLFEVAQGSSTVVTLRSFTATEGYVLGLAVDANQDLFGTLTGGGAGSPSNGSIFEIPHDSTAFTSLVSFNNTNLKAPTAIVMDPSDNLFGIAGGGDADGQGVIFELPHGSSSTTVLASFNGADGQGPIAITMDSSGNFYGPTEGITVGDFYELVNENPAPSSPVANIAASGVTTGGDQAEPIQVTYADDGSSIDTSTIASSNLTVTGPGGTLTVSLAGVVGGGSSVTATYSVATPAGGWTPTDNGNYTVTVVSGSVKDLAGNAVAVTTGSFTVNVAPTTPTDTQAPTASIAASDVTAAGAGSESVTIVYTDNVAVSAASIATGNIAVSGPAGNLTVTGVSLSPISDAATITATYTIAAPSGGWSTADNGNYTVSLLANQVTDTSGNAVAAQQASFSVNIPAPTPVGAAVGGKKPLVFDAGAVKLSATGGSVAVDQLGDDFDLVLTPKRVGGSMSVSIRGAALSLGDVRSASALHLVNFSAPAATLAGVMTINGAIGTIRLSNLAGKLVASSIASLSANALSGAVTTQGPMGTVTIGSLTGILAAGTSIHSLVATSVNNAYVLAGAYLGASATLDSTGDIYSSGSIGSLVLGSITNIFIGAGVNPVDGLFGNGDDTAEPGVDKIIAFKTKTAPGADVVVEAASFPKKVHIPGTTTPTIPVFVRLS